MGSSSSSNPPPAKKPSLRLDVTPSINHVDFQADAVDEEVARMDFSRSSTETLGGGRGLSMLERGGFVFLWLIGFFVAVKIMVEFQQELKPLVLSLIFVSILETIVQFWEAVLYYLTTWTRIIIRYIWLMLRVCVRKCCRGCCACLRKIRLACGCEPSLERIERDQLEAKFLCLKDLRKLKWHPSLAGTNFVIRWTAVALTMVILAGVFVAVFLGLKSNVDQMIQDSDGYRRMAVRVFTISEHQAVFIPDRLPDWVSNSTRESLRQKLVAAQGSMSPEYMADSLQENMTVLLTGFLANTEQLVMGAVFFLLYTILCLCDPLHINRHGKLVGLLNKWIVWPDESLDNDLQKFRQNEAGSSRDLLTDEEVTLTTCLLDKMHWDAPHFEVQVHIYKIVWQYMGLTVVINGVFALAAWGLLFWLELDLGGVIAVLSFFLSFIPELGTIVSTLLPLPLILFAPDCEIQGTCTTTTPPPDDDGKPGQQPIFSDWDERSKKMVLALSGMLLIKFLVSNVFGSWLFSRSKVLSGQLKGTETRETHPVIVLFAVVVFGHIWGTVGMLISVPMLSVMRLMLNLGYYMKSKRK